MTRRHLTLGRGVASIIAGALIATFAQFPGVAQADTKPLNESDPTTPVTVSTDPLPTTQIDGVAWTQLVVGNTVYVGGSFTTARPAGAAAGTNTVTRSNLLAYNLTTGVLSTTWAPSTNGDVLTITASPDKSRIYIGGSFTQVNGSIRNRIAALDPTTGALVGSFQPKPDASVKAIVATSSTVYFGGVFASVGGVARTKVAAVQASDGSLLSWAPALAGGNVNALAFSPDGAKLALGGSFTSANGSSNPGYGLAFIDPSTGASLAMPANSLVRNGGSNAAITSFSSDSDSLYASGYVFGSGGNLEGTTRIDWGSGSTVWVEDCHGDTYSNYPMGDVIYTVSHAHYCGNLQDGFPQTSPQWTFHWANAFTKAVTGTLKADPYGYYNWVGTPAPYLQKWLPNLTSGTYTGQGQAGWTVSGNSDYVVIGGEFPRAAGGGTTQQGLVRYAVRSIAPNKIGPEVTGSKFNPTLSSFVSGEVRIGWTANWDRDNENLTYTVIRDGITASPVYTVTQASSEWSRPAMGYIDTGLTPGQTYRYRVFATDPWGNQARSDTVYVTASASGALSNYALATRADEPSIYWRFGEVPSTVVNDWAGFTNATAGSGVTGGQAGAIIGDSDPASLFDGSTSGMAVSDVSEQGPDTFSVEAWINTTTTRGGKIFGFGNANTGNSSSYDRHVYMTNAGKLIFGVYPGTARTVTSSKSYNDGQWHHVVATLSSAGMVLYVDGQKVGSRTDTTFGQAYVGYWRVGGDNLGGWTSAPSSAYFNGTIDDVAIYPTALSASTVRTHYVDSGRTLPGMTAPADAYGAAVYAGGPDLYWRLAETSGTTVNDTTPNQLLGSYNSGVTLGGSSAVNASGDTSATFSGTSTGTAATVDSFTNPTTYAEELWFNTTTTRGGKLIGFSSSRTGSSSSYDRHVYMLNDGRLRYGVYTGSQTVIDSAQSYNDGAWHHLVAQQNSVSGMQLWVDGVLVGSNPQTGAQNYTGYWRIGGDNTWGGATSNYFAGSLDEVAVYSRTLSQSEILDHLVQGGGDLPNVAPVASFTSSVNKLAVSFDGSSSSDSDGTVASYLWDFGDGSTSTLAEPAHTYAAAGTYSVTLTVTDNEGATGTVTQDVTAVANALPTASFTSTVTKQSVSFASTASDPDGTVASYLWDFGDGGTSTLASPDHTYAAVATYPVTLTVTDNDGGQTTVTNPVTTLANQAPTADFTSAVDKQDVTFDGTGSTDADGTVASYLWDFGDGGSSTLAKPSHHFATVGDQSVTLTVTDDNGATGSVTKTVTTVANASPTASFTADVNKLDVSFDASASDDSDGTVASYAWDFGDGDSGTGKTPNHTYAAAGDYEVVLTVTDDQGATGSVTKTVTAVANAKPTAAFSDSVNDFVVSFDASASDDSDGTVASYAWDFGDGDTGTGKTPDHTYSAADTYQVKLTVTDNDGATDSVTHSVTTQAPAGPLAEDTFSRTVSNGWGSADTGGTWSRYGSASLFSVGSGVGKVTLASAGAGPRMTLTSVSSLNTEASVKLSLDKLPDGGGAYFSLGGRVTDTNGYRAKVKVASTGALTVYVVKVVNGAETTLASKSLGSSFNYSVGSTLQIKVQVTGASPTTIKAKAWKTSQSEPDWQLSTTDGSSGLQDAAGVSLVSYLSGSSTNFPIVASYDDLLATVP